MADFRESKDPNDIKPYFNVWCDQYGSNFSGDDGILWGAIITGSSWIMPTGSLVKNSDNTNGVTISGIVYSSGTVATIWLSSGTLTCIGRWSTSMTRVSGAWLKSSCRYISSCQPSFKRRC